MSGPGHVPPPPPEPSGQQPASQVPGAVTYATFGQRAGAALLDGLIIFGAMLVVFAAAAAVGVPLGLVNEALGGIAAGLLATAGYVGVLIVVMLMEAGPYGQTPGKHIVGIRVVDTSGNTITKGLSVGRYFAKLLSGMPCYLGYLWALWDAENRTWHDLIVSTRVVTATERAPSLLAVIRAPLTGRRAEPGHPSS